jgi:hypothetical protein
MVAVDLRATVPTNPRSEIAGYQKTENKKGEILANLSLLLNKIEELFLLLSGGLLGRSFLSHFFLSCHVKSPPYQIARAAQSRVNKNLSLR